MFLILDFNLSCTVNLMKLDEIFDVMIVLIFPCFSLTVKVQCNVFLSLLLWKMAVCLPEKKTVSYLLSHSTNNDFLSFNRVDILTFFQTENIVIISYGTEEDEKQILCHIYKSPATQFECHHCTKIVLCSLKLYTKCDQGPVSNSRKPRKLFGPVKPCLVHL